MNAIVSRAPAHQLESAVAEWLRATQRLARAVLRRAGELLVDYSRAGLMVRGGSRRMRRF